MPLLREPLNGGLVTSRHASLLEPGELSGAQDSRYRANDPAIWRAWGRTRYINSNGQVGGGSNKIKGLAFCPFDPLADGPSGDFLVAHVGDKYYTSLFTGRTGTISGTTIDSVGTGTHLDATHADNKWYLFNGNLDGIPNQVLKPGATDPTARRHGLVPVALSPANPTKPTVTTTAGTWPTDEAFWGEGRFFFFTTEVVNPGGVDELESAAQGEPPFVQLQKDGAGNIDFDVIVTRHDPLANSNATEIRVYMVKANLNQAWDMSLFARAFRVGTISVSGTAANDKIRLSGNYTFYDSVNNPTVTVVSGAVTNPNNMQVEDSAVAVKTNLDATPAVVDLTNWGFALPASSTVLGIKVWIRYRSRGDVAAIDVRPRFGAGPTLGTIKQFTTSNNDFVMHQQPWPVSDTDTWGLTLTEVEVNAATFGLRLSFNLSAAIDVVKIRLFTGTLPSIGPAYPIVAVQVENVLTIHHANMPPPTSTTGDVHDGQMVLDNVRNSKELSYSLPGKYDYFPSIYKIPIDGKDGDRVMVVRRVGDILMAFMRHQLVRINFLPLSVDPEFNPGRAYEELGADHGCVAKLGVTTFTPPGRSTLAAFVSDNGIYVTDTARCRIVTEDFDWYASVDVTQLSKAVLTNYAKEHVIRFDYIAAGSGATENNRYLLLHYHPSHLKGEEGHRFKITGPNIGKAASACIAKLLAEKILFTGHPTDGRLYVEDNGNDDAEGTGINFLIETRENYIAEPGEMVTMTRAWWHTNGAGASMTATSTPRYRNTSEALTSGTAETFTPGTEGLVLLQHHLGPVEGLRMQLSIPDAGSTLNGAVALTYLILDHNHHGNAAGD